MRFESIISGRHKNRPEMKNFFNLVCLVIILMFPYSVTAHSIGQPPYFKVNGIFTDYYPVPSSSLADFKLPQDIATGVFLINTPIDFEIDPALLPVPAEIVDKTKFLWEFGDGEKAEGLKNSHTYLKPGTYFLDIYADSEGGFEPQLLQSTAINIMPYKDYILPKSVITVNGKESSDPLLDLIDVNFTGKQKFNGNRSEAGSSSIVEYFWDLGDLNYAEGKEIIFAYDENPYTVFPVLRIKTKDGFIADSFVQIKDESAFSQSDSGLIGTKNRLSEWKWIIGAVVASLLSAGILTWILSRFLKK